MAAEVLQGSDITIMIYPTLDGKTPAGLSQASYILMTKSGNQIVLTKTLTTGVAYSNGRLSVSLNEIDTISLEPGDYIQECVARTTDGQDFFPLRNESLKVIKTTARI